MGWAVAEGFHQPREHSIYMKWYQIDLIEQKVTQT